MFIETPPIEGPLKSYLIRVFNRVFLDIQACRMQVISTVKNPIKGSFYLVETASAQFAEPGLYYYNGTVFKKLD